MNGVGGVELEESNFEWRNSSFVGEWAFLPTVGTNAHCPLFKVGSGRWASGHEILEWAVGGGRVGMRF